VDHAAVVRQLEAAEQLEPEPPHLRAAEPLAGRQPLRQRAAAQVLHHQEAVIERGLVDLDQRRVLAGQLAIRASRTKRS
jgi:hypothetical protein